MTANEARDRLKAMAEDLEGKYRILSSSEREDWAKYLRDALAILHPSTNGVAAPITRGDIGRLRYHAKYMRSQPGLVLRNLWPTEMADRYEEYLDAVGVEDVDS